jgi:nicotinamidase/pyrazinamidase
MTVKREALLIIDMLNDFVLPGAPLEVPETRNIIKNVRREIDAAHRDGRAVIYVCDTHAPDDREFKKFGWPAHGVKGTKGAEVIEDLKPEPGDFVVHKTTYSSFEGTDLDSILKAQRIDSVRLTGCVTHICILFTAYESVLRDYTVAVVKDGVAGIAKEDHDAALRIMRNVMKAEIVEAAEERKAA